MDARKKLDKRLIDRQLFWPLFALVVLLTFDFFYIKGFFHIEIIDGHLYGSLIDIVNRATPLMFMAIGMTLVIASGGIDISVGSVLAISGAITAIMIGGDMVFVDGVQKYAAHNPMLVAILVALIASVVSGLWNGLLIAKLGVNAMVGTLILLVAGRGIAQLIVNGNVITVYYEPFFYIGSGFFLGLPFSIYLVAAFLALVMWLVKKTAFGLFLESIGSNRVSSRFTGLDVQTVTWACYAISGLCAGIAGIIIASEVKSADANSAGLFIELDAILSVVLGGNSMAGGRFSIIGSVIGALVVQTLTTTIYAIGVPPEVTMVVKALVVIVIYLVQSQMGKTSLKAAGGATALKAKEAKA
ncbi:ABC transporter permease [uncultured Propionivibrio sp.]|uniref:ABC transporter permease n=1 Tax=uncultured Propionivibrio sp. TaxID=426737 RepID=UPI0029C07C8F|nr:ABC transporter permease [uncultured Propionivibrio sp.]